MGEDRRVASPAGGWRVRPGPTTRVGVVDGHSHRVGGQAGRWRLLSTRFSAWLTVHSRVPSAPSHLLELDVSAQSAAIATSTSFQSSDYQSSSLGWRDAGESRNGGGEVSHDVANGEGAIVEKDVGKVVLREKGWGDGPSRLKAILRIHAAGAAIAEVKVGLDGIEMTWGSGAVVLRLEAVWRKVRRDGVGRSWEVMGSFRSRNTLGQTTSESIWTQGLLNVASICHGAI